MSALSMPLTKEFQLLGNCIPDPYQASPGLHPSHPLFCYAKTQRPGCMTYLTQC